MNDDEDEGLLTPDPLTDTLAAWQRARLTGILASALTHADLALALIRSGHPWPHSRAYRITFMQWCDRQKLLVHKNPEKMS